MNKPGAFSIVVASLAAAFFAGRWSKSGAEAGLAIITRQTALPQTAPVPTGTGKSPARVGTSAATGKNYSQGTVSLENARMLTREGRLTLIRQGSLIFDGLRQAEFLAGVIPALEKEELKDAIKILGEAQGRGNFAAQPVWDAIWRQSGRLDPIGWLADMNATGGKTRSDARHVMEGWFETDPAAAEAWAQIPGKTGKEAEAAAALISWSSAGDLKKMEAALLALPPGDAVRRDAMQDYLDLTAATGRGDAASAYEKLPPELKMEGWAPALQQLSFGEPQTAVDWLTKHAGEPGTNYAAAIRLFSEITQDDPAAATAWLSRLPEVAGNENGPAFHPVPMTFDKWRRTEPAAADSWLAQQTAQTQWLKDLRARYPQRNQ